MWQKTKNGLHQQFEFKDFKEAFAFMNQVAALAEEHHHHPRWHNTYNHVEIWLSTHDAGGKITEKDELLASAIDQLMVSTAKLSVVPTHQTVKLYADGGSRGNPGPSASGFVIMDKNDKVLVEKGEYIGLTTNNQAEYMALKLGLEEAYTLGAREVMVFMDSLLVVNQMIGSFKVRNRDLWPLHQSIKDFLLKFQKVSFTHVPRELNKLADKMVNIALDAEIK